MARIRVNDGYDYEEYVLQELKRRGFRRLEQTKKSGDYGVDLLGDYGGRRYAIQCKLYAKPVDAAAVQEAVAGMAYYHCQQAMVVTNSTFTPAARALAEANDVTLLEEIAPAPDFWARRRPWELVLLAVQCVLFGLVFREMLSQGTVTPKGVGVLAGICFPGVYVAVRLLVWMGRRMRKK